jgi:integral membrane sensor domain MASE1
MKKWPFCLGVNLGLALGIFLCAILGRSMGIPGPALPISVVWPATGLSLAALLLFGYRAGLGVFVGNFIYNILFLSVYPSSLDLTPFHTYSVIIFISMGSLVQALVSTYIIRTYSTSLVFRTVKDIFIFLVPAGLLACLIGSTVGVTTLAIAGGLDDNLIQVWLTFWLGDTVGIYVITPLIVIWTLQPLDVKFSDHILSVVCMVFLFVVFSFLTYLLDYPLPHLFVPISIWAAYLFRMHGASLAIFLMTAASVLFAISQGYEGTSLISLITFIGVTIAASLIIASVVNERAQAWAILDSRNIYLEREVDMKVDLLEQVKSEITEKRMFATQEPVKKLLAIRIHASLSDMDLFTKSSEEAIEGIEILLTEQKTLTSEEKKLFSEKLLQIRQGLSDTINTREIIAEVLDNLKPNL